jgi:hypothetical protein
MLVMPAGLSRAKMPLIGSNSAEVTRR